jgi:Zn-dependent peptidase ImmA (M78 family)
MSAPISGTLAPQGEAEVCPSSQPALEVSEVKDGAKIKQEAAADAARVLRATHRVRGPVDPIAVAQELGIQVLVGELDRDRLGGLVIEPGEEPKIYMNQLDLSIRRRLTCAVELGHYVRHSARTRRYSRVDRRSERSSFEGDPDSVYAGAFAARLLLPDQNFETMVELGIGDLEMALRFQVPRELVQLRLDELGVRKAALAEA